jgi:hypothetical protein
MKNGNQPINPITSLDSNLEQQYVGLTKREYFAAMAMQGMFANSHATQRTIELGADVVDRFAIQAVMAADELLKQLENGN